MHLAGVCKGGAIGPKICCSVRSFDGFDIILLPGCVFVSKKGWVINCPLCGRLRCRPVSYQPDLGSHLPLRGPWGDRNKGENFMLRNEQT